MGLQFVSVFPLTIPTGVAVSNSLEVAETIGDAFAVGIQSPAALDALTFSLQVSYDRVVWADLHIGDPPALATLAGASIAKVFYDLAAFAWVRAKSSGNVAADRIFQVSKQSAGI